jgi:hypothetical protein
VTVATDAPAATGRFSSRKFLLALAVVATASVLCYVGKVSDSVYRDIVVATVATYLAANVTQKVKVA